MGKNIFDSYIVDKSKSLYKDNGRNVLSSDYLPDHLPHRGKQAAQLAQILAPSFNGSTPLNVLIYGKTGTGKTAVACYVQRELAKKKKALEMGLGESVPVDCHYINCLINNSPYGVMAGIANELEPGSVPDTGWSIEKVFRKLKENIEGINIVILDEIDKLFSKNIGQGNQLLYSLTNINSEIEKGKISLIGISNDTTYTLNLEQKVLGRIRGEQFVFRSYDATQLRDILTERVESAFYPNVVKPDVVAFCAALGAQQNGDARYALRLLMKAGDIAEQNKAVAVLSDHANQAKSFLEKFVIKEGVQKLTQTQKLLLTALVLNKNHQFTTGELYEEYAILCNTLRIERLTQRRITDLVSELDEAGLINAIMKSLGRGKGRTRLISLDANVPLEEIITGILDDDGRDSLEENVRKKIEHVFIKNKIYSFV